MLKWLGFGYNGNETPPSTLPNKPMHELLSHTFMPEKTLPTHYRKFQYKDFRYFWCEWYTLYLYSEHISGMINIIYLNVGNVYGKTMVYPALRIKDAQESHIEWDTYKLNEWQVICDPEEHRTHVRLGNCEIQQMDEHAKHFEFKGSSLNGTLEWDLSIAMISDTMEPIIVVDEVPLSYRQKMTFISQIPGGAVKGLIKRNGKDYPIHCTGELEHIFGNVFLPSLNWNLTHGYCRDNDVVVYWIHEPDMTSSASSSNLAAASTEEDIQKEEELWSSGKGSLLVQLGAEKHKWYSNEYRMEELFEDGNPTHPNCFKIQGKNWKGHYIEASIATISISATKGLPSASAENHVKIDIRIRNCKCREEEEHNYTVHGMAEYHRSKGFGGLVQMLFKGK